MARGTSNRLALGLLLCAAGASWASSVPSGAMADYYLQCGWLYSEAGCAALADRLEAVEFPSRDERLALVLSRRIVPGRDGGEPGEPCSDLHAIAADHPDYAEGLSHLAGCAQHREAVALLRRALEIERDNYGALRSLLRMIDHFLPDELVHEIGPGAVAAYREALYASALERAAWEAAAAAAASEDVAPARRWSGLFSAAASMVETALGEGDPDAAEAIRVRVRKDAGLDGLDYGVADNVDVVCRIGVYVSGEFCATAVERSAQRFAAQGQPLPDGVLSAIEAAAGDLRWFACAEATGQSRRSGLRARLYPECGPEATETTAVARLRAVLEHHDGPRSSEHHRVHAQAFLGDGVRVEGLRAALRTDPDNARARCDLAGALAREDSEAAALVLGEGGDPACLEPARVWGDMFGPR